MLLQSVLHPVAVCAAPSALLAHGIAKVNGYHGKSTFSKTKDSINIASEFISHK